MSATDFDPVTRAAAYYQYDRRRAEGIIELNDERVPVALEAYINNHDNAVLIASAWGAERARQDFGYTIRLDDAFEMYVERHDLEEVDDLSNPDDLMEKTA